MTSNFYENSDVINIDGYEIYFTRFADSIIKDHFQEAVSELSEVLNRFKFTETQLMSAGGSLSSIAKSLRDKLYEYDWIEVKIENEHKVKDKVLTSESHKIDHYKEFVKGNIGLEIEWNTKDPFFDRDLENFRKLHQVGELALGIIITRGQTLQVELLDVYKRYLSSIYPYSKDDLSKALNLSQKAETRIQEFIELDKENSINSIAKYLCSSKYGTSTTHMSKLIQRVDRGVGDPCPCILIGIEKERITE